MYINLIYFSNIYYIFYFKNYCINNISFSKEKFSVLFYFINFNQYQYYIDLSILIFLIYLY